jgi:hypothetical protein
LESGVGIDCYEIDLIGKQTMFVSQVWFLVDLLLVFTEANNPHAGLLLVSALHQLIIIAHPQSILILFILHTTIHQILPIT